MSTTSTSSRTVDGVQLPASGTYTIDPSHSHVGFKVRHLVVAKVRGRFSSFEGTVVVSDEPTESSVEVTIDPASIDTRDEQRDAHLRSPDFFDVENHSAISYRSTSVTPTGKSRWKVDGELTIHGVTRPVWLDVEFQGLAQDPWGNSRAAFTASTEIEREDFGLSWNQALETGGFVVGKTVTIEIEAEVIRQP